jgi:acetate kinase
VTVRILVINSGSSSIKYQLFDMGDSSVLTSGLLERIGEGTSHLKYRWRNDKGGYEDADWEGRIADHREGMRLISDVTARLGGLRDLSELSGIGHRVVHGAEAFREPVIIDDRVIECVREMVPLAPLHNPANLTGIEVARSLCPGVPQVAVFDTAFHQSMPPGAYRYAIPKNLYETLRVRRYGFHGTSHAYVAKQAASHLGRPLAEVNLITLHLGNGASATAVKGGLSVDTSMGMTPLEGLVMGTRCGDIDPAIHFYLYRTSRMSFEQIESLLNKESGLKGICGVNDMREVGRLADGGDQDADLAIEIFCRRIKKYIGAYYAVLGALDAVVFTGGIGENAAFIRNRSCQGLEALGIVISAVRNGSPSRLTREIQAEDSKIKILVVPTNEELEIAVQTARTISGPRAVIK